MGAVSNDARPAPFSVYTTPEMWSDPHIAARMLAFHLDPDNDLASRSPAAIERTVDWLVPALGLGPGSRLLDLGCGPGLYAVRFARRGIRVSGVDVSESSVGYATDAAGRESLPAAFTVANYLEDPLGDGYDAAILIYEDYCALSPSQRSQLLGRVHAALRPGGRFAFDVTAAPRLATFAEGSFTERNLMDGFWSPSDYTGRKDTWVYPEQSLALERYVIEADGRTREFWVWTHCLTPDQVSEELVQRGFAPSDVYGDLGGSPYDPDAVSFAVVATRS
jgi:cyclopropane fatty-acyl-phospholipid synthase-like methyltransferase